ncbi:hypothetical protein PVK06_027578 [Gossypium arboreum]|uniref:Uncharacterized protein n=1 Tax=Gossypium arboreum TaxID=29729 RepID=A0ABR0P0W8_GOSAR|nr:hypothetical protein PVK06_027578 [Gossypium arboreum]
MLGIQGIKLPNFAYDFSILRGLHWLLQRCLWSTLRLPLVDSHAIFVDCSRRGKGCVEEPVNSFYHYYEKRLRPFALAESSRMEGGSQQVNLLVASTNHRVIASVWVGRDSKDTSSTTDNISCELNKAMDIDSLVTEVRKKWKTITGVVRISSVSNEERGSVGLECQCKRRSKPVGIIATLAGTQSPSNTVRLKYEEAHWKELANIKTELARALEQRDKMMDENETINNSNVNLQECLSIVEIKAEGLEQELITERESKEALQAELNGAIEEYTTEKDRIVQECHDQMGSMLREQRLALEDFKKKRIENIIHFISRLYLNTLLYAQVATSPFDICKVDLDALAEYVLCPSGTIWKSFVSTWNNSPDFYVEEDPTIKNMIPSANSNIVPIDNVNPCASKGDDGHCFSSASFNVIARSFVLYDYVGGCGISPARLSMIVGSFSLVNYVEGYGFSPTGLSMIARSFALTNYVRGSSSTGSFTIANCARGCCFLPASLSTRIRSFVLANFVGGCDSSLASLSTTIGSFALANSVGGCDSLHLSLSTTIRSFSLINCVRGFGFLPMNLKTIARTFTITNYAGAATLRLRALMTAWSFALTICSGSCGSSPKSLRTTAGSFTFANCFEGCSCSSTILCTTAAECY